MPRRVEYFGVAAQLPPEELPTLSDVIRQAKYYQETLLVKSLGLSSNEIGRNHNSDLRDIWEFTNCVQICAVSKIIEDNAKSFSQPILVLLCLVKSAHPTIVSVLLMRVSHFCVVEYKCNIKMLWSPRFFQLSQWWMRSEKMDWSFKVFLAISSHLQQEPQRLCRVSFEQGLTVWEGWRKSKCQRKIHQGFLFSLQRKRTSKI